MAPNRPVGRRMTLGWQVWVIVAVVFVLLVFAGVALVIGGPAFS